MLPLEHSAIRLTCIKRLSVFKPHFGFPFEWPLETSFSALEKMQHNKESKSKVQKKVRKMKIEEKCMNINKIESFYLLWCRRSYRHCCKCLSELFAGHTIDYWIEDGGGFRC